MDKFSRRELNLLITSLEPGPLLHESANSGRPVKWIPLPLLQDVFKLFKGFQLNEVIKCVVLSCNGHPRSLEAVKRAIERLKAEGKNLEHISSVKLMDLAAERYNSCLPGFLLPNNC